jgi:hypothetical protein
MNGIIISKKIKLVDSFFSLGCCRLLFADPMIFLSVCFLITVVSWLAWRQCEEWNLFTN